MQLWAPFFWIHWETGQPEPAQMDSFDFYSHWRSCFISYGFFKNKTITHKCPEKRSMFTTRPTSSCGQDPILFVHNQCFFNLVSTGAVSCPYGPDHPLREKRSHSKGHHEEVNEFSRRIIGTISIYTTSCQICCWCSANHFPHGRTG